MYAWPKELDPARFVGLSVRAITFFEYGFHITLWESGPEASHGDVTISVYHEPELIVGDSVQEITFPPTTTEILMRSDLANYECYEILIDGDRYIV
jgi:hypothetical protein